MKALWQFRLVLNFLMLLVVTGCATQTMNSDQLVQARYNGNLPLYHNNAPYSNDFNEAKYAARVPQTISTKGKVIIVDPRLFAWGAYQDGSLVKAGIASAGADWCEDEQKPCRTTVGTFKIYSLGSEGCVSRSYPVGKGGSLMPFCMFFNNGESLHGSPDGMFREENISHGCVHLRIPDAEWIRFNFASVGTKVMILPYD